VEEVLRFLKGRSKAKAAAPRVFDECIYSPYSYRKEDYGNLGRGGEGGYGRRRSSGSQEPVDQVVSRPERRYSDSAVEEVDAERRREGLVDLTADTEVLTSAGETTLETGLASGLAPLRQVIPEDSAGVDERVMLPDFDTTVHIPEVFLFEYGVVVIWGMTLKEEQRFLKEIAKFEQEKLGKDDVQTEEFNFYYTREYQARIYNDFISLREKRNYMTKLAISHALAQSTKVSLSSATTPCLPI